MGGWWQAGVVRVSGMLCLGAMAGARGESWLNREARIERLTCDHIDSLLMYR